MVKEKKEKKFRIPPDGTVVRGSDGAVSVIEGGKRRHIPNVFTYIRMGISANYVVQMEDEEIEAIPVGKAMPEMKPERKKGKR